MQHAVENVESADRSHANTVTEGRGGLLVEYAGRVLEIFALAKWAKKRQQRPATYDQIAITPTMAQRERFPYDVFDFDNAIFAAKWNALVEEFGEEDANPKFNPYVKFHISDHRPIWMQLDTAV